MINYEYMNETEKKVYDAFADEVDKIRGASVWDGNEPFVQLKKCAYTKKDIIKNLIKKYGYQVIDEHESEGSDYTAYYIYFKERD